MKYTVIAIVALVILVGGAFLLRGDAPNTNGASGGGAGSTSGESLGSLPDVLLTDRSGSQVPVGEALERNSLVNSWASWCPFCVHELPDFDEFALENEGSIDVLIVNRGEDRAKGDAFLDSLGLADSSLRVFYNEDEALYRGTGGFAMPETLFVTADGEIVFHKRGPLSKQEIERITTNLGWK